MAKKPSPTQSGNRGLGGWRGIIEQIPPTTRFFAVVVMIVEIVLGAIIPLSDDETKKYIVVGMILLGVISVIFVGMGQLLQIRRDHVVVPAPPVEERGGKIIRYKYDVFVSAPIDSLATAEEREKQRAGILAIIERIKSRSGLESVYYAGDKAKDPGYYDPPNIGLQQNVQRIRASTYFLLIYPELLATSALVELGMSLALGKPNVWFVKKGAELPYLLRGAIGGAGRADLPLINVFEFEELGGIVKTVETYGDQIFNFD